MTPFLNRACSAVDIALRFGTQGPGFEHFSHQKINRGNSNTQIQHQNSGKSFLMISQNITPKKKLGNSNIQKSTSKLWLEFNDFSKNHTRK